MTVRVSALCQGRYLLLQVTQRTSQQLLRFIQNPQEVVAEVRHTDRAHNGSRRDAIRETELSNLGRSPGQNNHKPKAI